MYFLAAQSCSGVSRCCSVLKKRKPVLQFGLFLGNFSPCKYFQVLATEKSPVAFKYASLAALDNLEYGILGSEFLGPGI